MAMRFVVGSVNNSYLQNGPTLFLGGRHGTVVVPDTPGTLLALVVGGLDGNGNVAVDSAAFF